MLYICKKTKNKKFGFFNLGYENLIEILKQDKYVEI